MVTIDDVIKNVGVFKGDIKEQRRDYERAKQGLERIKEEKSRLESTIKAQTGYDNFVLPESKDISEYELGPVTFNVRSEKRIKRPQYKTAVTEMENYLTGINNLLDEGKTITGVIKKGNQIFMDTEKLLESYEIIVAGVMAPEIKQTIKYKSDIDTDRIDQIVLSSDTSEFNEENAINYVKMDKMEDQFKEFTKAYEEALAKDQEGENITPVNTRSGYKTKRSQSKGVDWGYVVKTLVSVPTDENVGELDELADPSLSKAQKDREFGYSTMYHEVRGEKKLYVSLQSVYQRIQELKDQSQIVADRISVKGVDIV